MRVKTLFLMSAETSFESNIHPPKGMRFWCWLITTFLLFILNVELISVSAYVLYLILFLHIYKLFLISFRYILISSK